MTPAILAILATGLALVGYLELRLRKQIYARLDRLVEKLEEHVLDHDRHIARKPLPMKDIYDCADAIAEKYGSDAAARWVAAIMSWSASDQAAFEAEGSPPPSTNKDPGAA